MAKKKEKASADKAPRVIKIKTPKRQKIGMNHKRCRDCHKVERCSSPKNIKSEGTPFDLGCKHFSRVSPILQGHGHAEPVGLITLAQLLKGAK